VGGEALQNAAFAWRYVLAEGIDFRLAADTCAFDDVFERERGGRAERKGGTGNRKDDGFSDAVHLTHSVG
jgi:hypothetical protein